jgi:excisionase family DNA binding protein
MLGVSVSTVQKMVESGKLKAWKTQGGHRRIPLAEVQSAARRSEAVGKHRRGPLSVLVVEDNPLQMKLYRRLLSQWGDALEVEFASDGAQALVHIATRRPDLVITDLVMAPLDGFHLIKTLRASPEFDNVRIVVVTGLTPDEVEEGGGLDPRVLLYRKPLVTERLSGYIDAQIQAKLVLGLG